MYRHFIPLGRLMNNVPPATENIPIQSFKLTCRKQNLVIYRQVHDNHGKRNKKEKSSDLFDKLKQVKVKSDTPFLYKKDGDKLFKGANDGYTKQYNIVRPEKLENENGLQDRLFEYNNKMSEEEWAEKIEALKILSSSMTPELEAEIVGDTPNKKFMLKQALYEIERLETRRGLKFTFPKTLTVEQWNTLISLNDERSRAIYVQSLEIGDPSLEEILEKDRVFSNPLQIDPALIEELELDAEGERRIKIFLMEHEMQRQEGEMVPYLYDRKDVINMTEIKSGTGRANMRHFMLKREMTAHFEDMRKRERRHGRSFHVDERKRMIEEQDIYYGLGENCIHLRTSKQTMNSHYNWRAVREFNDWGIPLVIDLSFTSKYKTDRIRNKSLVNELLVAVGLNRESNIPFQLHMTGTPDMLYDKLNEEVDNCVNMTQESHLDMFPHERLVYLSPDSRNDLKKFNKDDIYVIGGIIDKIEKLPLTLTAAKKMNIRHARFPMRQVIGLHHELNIDTCVAIMNDLKDSNDWFYAMRWLPSRCLYTRIVNNPNPSIEHQLMFRAHRQLSPTAPNAEDKNRNARLTPAQYRYYYRKIMECKSQEEMDQVKQELVI